MSKTLFRTQKSQRKAKKSYTLSPESVAFLENLRKKQHAASTSLVLDEILRNAMREQEKNAIDEAVSDYYGSISEHEQSEQSEWGEFALTQFPAEDGR